MRLYNWESRLSAYAARVAREGFAWGRHDCALFAAGAVEAVTGTDPAAAWRGQYRTRAGGMRLIRAAGFADHVAAAESWFPRLDHGMHLPGDLAVFPAADKLGALGVVMGELAYVLRRDELGLTTVSGALYLLAVR